MPVQIGQTPDRGFDEPFGLLSDCHRRIERFLGAMVEIARRRRGASLDQRDRDSLEKALRYFREAAPWHTADEEHSLFPRLRKVADPATQDALATMQTLEADHRRAEQDHAEAERLARHWLDAGSLETGPAGQLTELLASLQQMYQRHIAAEDEQLFPAAERVLDHAAIRAMGREMAERRGLDLDQPEPRCKHSQS